MDVRAGLFWVGLALASQPLSFLAPRDLAWPVQCVALAALALQLVRWPWLKQCALRRPRAVLFCLGLGISALLASEALAPHPALTGDEPAYLVIASSLVRDSDLDVGNNYRQKDYRGYGVRNYRAFGVLDAERHLRPHHGPGLGLLLYAPFRVAEWLRESSPALALFLLRLAMGLALGAFLAVALQLALEAGAAPESALGACVCAALSCPLLFYSTQLYPDLPAGCLLACLALAAPPLPLACAALALLPLLGVKYLVPASVLGLGLAWKEWRRGASNRAVLVCLGLALGWGLYHSTKVQLDLGGHFFTDVGPRLLATPWWLFGYLMDQRAGLLLLAPFYLVAARGLRLNLPLVAAALYLGVYAYHLDWGGYCPPGRPLIAVLWVFVVAVALGWERTRFKSLLFTLGLLVSLAYLVDPEARYLHLHPNAQERFSPLLEAWSPPWLSLAALFPFVSVDHAATLPNLAWLLILGLALQLLGVQGPQAPGKKIHSLPLLLAVALSLWAAQLRPSSLPSNDAGPEFTDGWLPAGRWVRVWLPARSPGQFQFSSLISNEIFVRGWGLRERFLLEAGQTHTLPLPAPPLFDAQRVEVWVRRAVVPSEVSASKDDRSLGCRLELR